MNLDDLDGAPDGAELLGEVRRILTRYVVLPSPEAFVAVALWIAATHLQNVAEYASRLALVSPEMRCGKSRVLDLIEAMAHRALMTVNATTAAIVRSFGDDPPTLLVDEADRLFGTKRQAENNEDLCAILNAGHSRNRPLLRWDMTGRKLEQLPTYGMACLASKGDVLPDTIMDRAVVIRMRRKGPGEKVAKFRGRDAAPLHVLRDQLTGWAETVRPQVADAEPDIPDLDNDRAEDTWEPLIAVADAAGGEWPALARQAAIALTADQNAQSADSGSVGVRLLTDLRTVFGDADGLWTTTIIERLAELDEAPWADWYGRRITPRDLAKLLRPFGVKSRDVRQGGTGQNLKGYARADLYAQWVRYVRDMGDIPGQSRRGHVADEPEEPRHEDDDLTFDDLAADEPDDPCRGHVADDETASATGLTSDVADVADIAEDGRSALARALQTQPIPRRSA